MKTSALLAIAFTAIAALAPAAEVTKADIEAALKKGIAFYEANQAESGAWGDESNPAITGISVTAILQAPGNPRPASVDKAIKFILSNVNKEDGGIYGKGLATYNTALCLTALSLAGDEELLPVIANARRMLIGQQQDYDTKGETDNVLDGGIGYGGSYTHSDLSNTHFAIEALYHAKKALADSKYADGKEVDLDWDAAIDFVSRCQNSEATVKDLGESVGLRDEDRGGFVYFPGNTKSDEIELEGKKKALRSYGSMSYAGLLSFIYADMDKDDARIKAVKDWLGRHYTLEENPGMEGQGLFYYFHTMGKALSVLGEDELVLADGKKIDWKQELAAKLIALQNEDGSWTNKLSNRWRENDPHLVTGYAMISLEHILRAMGE
ncbi:MAG: prenyltransferase/squalene oxidase repeat-containing protein [Verrucomicrobiales bacterium]